MTTTWSTNQVSGQELRMKDRTCELYLSGPLPAHLKSSILILHYYLAMTLELGEEWQEIPILHVCDQLST